MGSDWKEELVMSGRNTTGCLVVLGINAKAKPNVLEVQFLELFTAKVSILSWNSVMDNWDIADKQLS